ncbi:hypothetical protein L7F22_064231 [Adiantum nelumboides]|nr:hypothetical protein [Adiantum nelumboides]
MLLLMRALARQHHAKNQCAQGSENQSSLTGESLHVEKEIGGSDWEGTINLIGYLCIETSVFAKVTTTYAIAQVARKGLLVKGEKYLEALGRIKVVAMDKASTLTEGCFQVVEVENVNKNADLLKLLHWVSCTESKARHPIASAVVEYAKSQGSELNGQVDDFRTLVGEGVSGTRARVRSTWLFALARESRPIGHAACSNWLPSWPCNSINSMLLF